MSPGLPEGLRGKESVCDAEDAGDPWDGSLDQENLLEEGTATHSSVLAWRMPWMEETDGLQSTGSQTVGQDFALGARAHTHTVPHTLTSTCSSLDFQSGALQGIHEQSGAQDARVGVPQAACLGSGVFVCVHMRVSALCLHTYTHIHVWLCVQKPTCAQTCGPSAAQVQVPKGPHPRTLGVLLTLH